MSFVYEGEDAASLCLTGKCLASTLGTIDRTLHLRPLIGRTHTLR